MQLETRKLLEDVRRAAEKIMLFTAERTRDDFARDDLLRSAVERQFEIIGEALNRLLHSDDAILKRITDYRRIIAFRNVLIHGYDAVDDEIVWDAVTTKLPILRSEVDQLIGPT